MVADTLNLCAILNCASEGNFLGSAKLRQNTQYSFGACRVISCQIIALVCTLNAL